MRILMAVPKYPFPVVGGLERQAHELSKTLVARGHIVHAVSGLFDPAQKKIDLIDGVWVHRMYWSESRSLRFLWLPFTLTHMVVKLMREMDLVHVHNISWFGAFITLIAKALGLPVITKLPNIGDFGIPGMRLHPFGFLRVTLLRHSDAIIAMTPESMVELAEIGYPSGMVLKVSNGISLSPSNFSDFSSRLNGGSAIFVGRLSLEKGLIDLLYAWVTVKNRYCHAKLRILGEGPQESELKLLSQTLSLGDSVEFCGFCADVQAELEKADLFVLPSYAEGNSNAILEAMRSGLPVVATRVGGAAIQVGSEGVRFLFKPGDREALAGHLVTLIEDKALRNRQGMAMRNRVESTFAIDRVAVIYETAYQLLVTGCRQQIGQLNPYLFNQS